MVAVPAPSAQQTVREALRRTLLKMAAAGRVLCLLGVPSWRKQLHMNSRTPSSLPIDKIPIKQPRPQLFLLWGRVCTLELNLEPLHSWSKNEAFLCVWAKLGLILLAWTPWGKRILDGNYLLGRMSNRTSALSRWPFPLMQGFPGGSAGKETACNVGGLG